MHKNLKVYGFKKGWQGIMEMDNFQTAGQEFVDGMLRTAQVAESLVIVYNEDGFILCLEPRVLFWEREEKEVDTGDIRYIVYGDCFVCRIDEKENFVSLRDDDVKTINHHLKAVSSISDGIIYLE